MSDTLKLYSPLYADFFPIPAPEPEELDNGLFVEYSWMADGRDLAVYADLLTQAVESDEMLAGTDRGLMEWFDGSPEVAKKVASVFPQLEEIHGILYGVTVCQLREPLTPSELTELKRYIQRQYEDGWGEHFSQEMYKTPEGNLYLYFHSDYNFSLRTAQEMGKESDLSKAAQRNGSMSGNTQSKKAGENYDGSLRI